MSEGRSASLVAAALRDRLSLARPLSDLEILRLGVGLALVNQAQCVVKYSHSREVIVSLPTDATGLTDDDWACLFSLPRATTNPQIALELSSRSTFGKHVKRMRAALVHSLQEPGLRSSFEQPLSRLLVFLALNTPADGCVERIEAVIGAVIRTDRRTLEDLRAEYESEVCELMLLGEAIEAVVSAVV